jgi:hypothetical protein
LRRIDSILGRTLCWFGSALYVVSNSVSVLRASCNITRATTAGFLVVVHEALLSFDVDDPADYREWQLNIRPGLVEYGA